MSCRVLKRDMEPAMLDALVMESRRHGVTEIRGCYIATEKNGLVADHYSTLGFRRVGGNDLKSEWKLDISGELCAP